MTELRPVHAGVAGMVSQRCASKRWSLTVFAKKVGVDRATLWRITHRMSCPKAKTLRGLARALGVPVDQCESLLVPTEADALRARARKMGVEL